MRLGETKTTTIVKKSFDHRPSLFIGLLSYCSNRDRRDAIRQTWLSRAVLDQLNHSMRVQFRFVLGQPDRNDGNKFCAARSIEEEASVFGDLLLLDEMPESYQVLTRKSIAMIKWACDNVDPDFIFKTDDDSYVALDTLVSAFLQIQSPDLPLYFGSFKSKSLSFSTAFDRTPGGRWYTKPENFPVDAQRYAVGAGYALSRPLAKHVSNMVKNTTFLVPWGPEREMGWLEDGAIGYLLRGAVDRAGRVSAWTVNDLWYPIWCYGDFDLMVLHHLEASQQFDAHRIFTKQPRNSSNGLCKLLHDTFSVVKHTAPSDKQNKEGTSWGGSFLEHPLSPLLTNPPPLFPSWDFNISVIDQNVIVISGATKNIGRLLVQTIQRGYSRIPGPLTIVAICSPASTPLSCSFPTPTKLDDPSVATVEVIRVDIRNYDDLQTSLEPYAPRIRGLIHLAAISRVQDCASNTTSCIQVNVNGTKNFMKFLWTFRGTKSGNHMRQKFPWMLFASSREVYGALGPHDVVDENSELRPVNVYGESKLQAEIALRHWAHRTRFNVVALRFTNVYGSCHDQIARLVPQWASSLASESDVRIRGNAGKTVSLLHIQDAIQGIVLAIRFATTLENAAGYYEAFNIGGGASHDVLKITEILRTMKSAVANLAPGCLKCLEAALIKSDTSSVHEPDHYRGSIDKAFRVLGFQPSHTFDVPTVQEYIHLCGFMKANRSSLASLSGAHIAVMNNRFFDSNETMWTTLNIQWLGFIALVLCTVKRRSRRRSSKKTIF